MRTKFLLALIVSVTNTNGHTMNMDFTFSSKYLGPACGDVK